MEFQTKPRLKTPVQRARPLRTAPLMPSDRSTQTEIRRILRSSGAQAKLTIGQPNDKYEQEADAVADKVMRMRDADVAQRMKGGAAQPMQIQRLCPECEEEMAQRQPMEEEEEAFQAKEIPGQTPQVSTGIESRINSLKSGGTPLDAATRSLFEPRFGRDFSHVRVHHGGPAADVSRDINARAFTLGNHVMFDSGEYSPETNEGRRLLGHELTHVVQQGAKDSAIQRTVYQCCRNVQTGKSFLDSMSAFLGLQHCWIRTDSKAGGMGPADDGPLPANPLGIPTKITDHAGERGTCTEYPSADESCVNQRLKIGKETGSWYPWNNCNTLVSDILHGCDEQWQAEREAFNEGLGEAYSNMDFCWVAREVIPERWMDVRRYLLGDAPAWLRDTYGRYGQQFAAFIHDKAWLKIGLRPIFAHWANKGVSQLGGWK